MRRMSPVLIVVVVALAGCDGEAVRPMPMPVYVPVVHAIAIGEEVKETFVGAALVFEVIAPTQGTLVAELAWGPSATGSLLTLVLADRTFRGSPPDWSPIVGKVSVAGGQRYSVIVDGSGTDEYFDDPFVLKTWME